MVRSIRLSAWLACWCVPLFALAFQNAGERSPEERLAVMRGAAEKLKVRTAGDGDPVEVPLNSTPLLHFNDPARDLGDASLWAWGENGRPVCVLTMERYGAQWFLELISLSSDPFT